MTETSTAELKPVAVVFFFKLVLVGFGFFAGFDLHLSGAHLEQSWKRRRGGRGC